MPANKNNETINSRLLNKIKALIKKRENWEANERAASRTVQYAIIADCYEVHLEAKKDPVAYRAVAREIGLKVSANMDTANLVTKVIFGSDEPGRLPGITAVLRVAEKNGITPAELPAWLDTSGGIQGVRTAKKDAKPASVSTKADKARTLLSSGQVKGALVPNFGAPGEVADETGYAIAIVRVTPANQVEVIHISGNKSALNAVLAEYADGHDQEEVASAPRDTLEVEVRALRKQSLDQAYEDALR